MKSLLATFLILAVTTLGASEAISPASIMTSAEMSSATGGDFWGGAACGAAVAGVAVGLAAAAVTTGGAGIVWAIAAGTSIAGHVSLFCAMLD